MPKPEREKHSGKAEILACVIGGSAGSMSPLLTLLGELYHKPPFPILLVHHLHKDDQDAFPTYLSSHTRLPVREPEDKTKLEAGCLYPAPANYHMLLETPDEVSLSIDAKVNYARPSIDVLFESAASACGPNLVAILLSGANSDGAEGIRHISVAGGLCLVQSPESAECLQMPAAAIACTQHVEILDPLAIGHRLRDLCGVIQTTRTGRVTT